LESTVGEIVKSHSWGSPAVGLSVLTRRLTLAVVLMCGCEEAGTLPELPELTIEIEGLRIGLADDYEDTPCAGDLSRIEAHLSKVESLTGIRRSSPIDVYLMSPEGVCPEGARACYRGDVDAVFSSWGDLRHEVVHAVEREELDFPSVFWAEGHAEAGRGLTSWKSIHGPLLVEDLGSNDLVNYVSAGHFARYLVETRGWGAYQDAIERGVEEVFGISEAELVAEYEREAPAAYPPRDPCPFPELESDGAEGWRESFNFSCDTPGATQYEYRGFPSSPGAALLRSVELEAGTYEVELEGGREVVLLGCHTEELDVVHDSPSNGDLQNETGHGLGKGFESGEIHKVTVTSGVYRVAVSSGTEGMGSMILRLRRAEE